MTAMRHHPYSLPRTLAVLATALTPLPAQGDMGPYGVKVRQEAASMADKLGAMVDRSLEFTDERGYPLKLSQFFPGQRPVILDLGYFGCPRICGAVMHGMVDALGQLALEPGQDYDILSVSIDAREHPELAKAKKESFLVHFAKLHAEEGWHFAVGKEPAIQALTSSVGFRFFWSEHTNSFEHPSALVFLSPDGKVTRVLQALPSEPGKVEFPAGDVKLALLEASEGKLGTFWDKVQLSCLTFDPVTHTYSVTAMTVMRIGGVVTLAAIALMITIMLRREKQRRTAAATVPA